MAFKTGAVANEFLELAQRDGVRVTPMMLQKLLYFAHGWHLAVTGNPLIDDQVEAWKFGPVVPSIYHEFKTLGGSPIGNTRSMDIVERGNTFNFVPFRLKDEGDTPEVQTAREIIHKVWNTHKHLTGMQMSNITHLPGSPWTMTWESMGPVKRLSKDIPDEMIRDYFRSQART